MSVLSRFAAVALLVLAPPVRAAEPTDIADVFPAGTLAFAELHKPAEFAPQLAALFKGTPLDDGLAFIHNRRDKTTNIQDIQGKPELALAGLVASPEMLAELKKLRGVGVGLTGFTDLGEPEVALAVLTADTPAVGLAARAFLSMDSTVRKVGAVGTVPVYQLRPPAIAHDPMTGQPKLANEKPPVEGPHEPTFAYLPGLFVVGTSKKAVAEVVTRFQGTAKDSLSSSPLFQEAAAGHRRAGVFYFVNAPAFVSKFEAAVKQKGDVPGSDLVAWVKMLAGAKALRSVAGCATFRDNGLSLGAAGAFEAGQKSPLFDFLAVPGVTVELLHHAPRPATFAAAVTLPAANRSAGAVHFKQETHVHIARLDRGEGKLAGEPRLRGFDERVFRAGCRPRLQPGDHLHGDLGGCRGMLQRCPDERLLSKHDCRLIGKRIRVIEQERGHAIEQHPRHHQQPGIHVAATEKFQETPNPRTVFRGAGR